MINAGHHSVEHPETSYLAGMQPVVNTVLLFIENEAILHFYWKIMGNFARDFLLLFWIL